MPTAHHSLCQHQPDEDFIYQEVDKAAKKEARFLKKQKKEAKKGAAADPWTLLNLGG
jgi:hypothetical protein